MIADKDKKDPPAILDNISGETSSAVRRYAVLLSAGWTVCIALSLGYTIFHLRTEMLHLARMRAELTLNKDMVYRTWASSKGGLYVPMEGTEPNPYLNVPNREVMTTAGHYLTLMNPAYMTRQVNEMQKKPAWRSVILPA